MTFGVYLPISHPSGLPAPRTVVDYAREAESLGFDGVWVGDHLLWRTPLLEATTALAAVAGATSTIGLGTNVYLLGLRPSLLSAKVVGTLAYFAGDRLTLGVGVGGEFPAEFEALGVPLRERGARLDRAIDEVRGWWGHGPREPTDAPPVGPSPSADMPLWIGGRSEPALRRTIRTGARAWSAHFSTPEQLATARDRLAVLAGEADVPMHEVAVTLNINVGDDGGEDARAFTHAHFGMPPEKIAHHVVGGDLETCVERVTAYLDIADHVVLFPASFDVPGQLHRLGELRATVAGAHA
jgi:alkanesulfonate monooxygenase SsuD/methylene tetrahydromethanopterin reductase-like flavin-dependent oxidoreductase (luciferase family)